MSLREEQCKKVCRILDDVLANRPTERDALCVAVDKAFEALKQPEIVYCKDCKNWIPYDWMFSETWQSQNRDDYPQDEIGCSYGDMVMKADDFCSRAERIKGEAE